MLFLIYDLERGGPELRLLDFVKHFPKEANIHVLVTSRKVSLLAQFQELSNNIRIMPIRKGYLGLMNAWRILKYVRANRIRLLNSYDFKDLFVITFVNFFSGNKLGTIYHAVELVESQSLLRKCVLEILLRNTNAVICNSDTARKNIQKRFGLTKNVTVIKNGVNVDVFKKKNVECMNLRDRLGIEESDIVIGTVANFRKEKNYPFLLSNFKLLSERIRGLKLVCVGGGYALGDMKRRCWECGLKNKVLFTGYVDEVVQYLTLLDIFVLCSSTESFPNALLQAMSMELPVVVSKVGGCSEIVDHMQNGVLYASNDQKEFLAALELLIQSPGLRHKFGIHARRTVVENFSLEKMIAEYLFFFRSLSGG